MSKVDSRQNVHTDTHTGKEKKEGRGEKGRKEGTKEEKRKKEREV